VRNARSESICPLRTVLLSRIRSTVVTPKFSSAAVDEGVAAVEDGLQVLAGAGERQSPSSLDGDRAQASGRPS
jgi:hypothetical protein